jgi:branched-chain amino acid transport system ATP-binding protein
MLAVSGIDAYYGLAHILSAVSLTVHRGEVVALLGRNGAGKSTTMKSIVGLVRPAAGRVRFLEQEIAGRPVHRIARLGVGYVPEDRRIFTELTVAENLEVGRQPRREGYPLWTAEKVYQLFPSLGRMRGRPGGQMSGGEQQMLTIARTLMGNPALVLLDEPSEGLAPVVVEQMAKTIVDLKCEGLTVIISEQNLYFASLVSDRAYIIEKGRIRYEGTMEDLSAHPEIREAYLTV